MSGTWPLILLLLAAAVAAVAVMRRLELPSLLAYLLVGTAAGPYTLHWLNVSGVVHALADFGVVFLMFSVGLQFSLQKLKAVRRLVFGLGLLQVVVTAALVAITARVLAGWPLAGGIALGCALAMSSTAIVGKMMADRLEVQLSHGRQVMAVLLFQDLAVVPLLLLLPALASAPSQLLLPLAAAIGKSGLLLAAMFGLGRPLLRRWFAWIARTKSSELFVLNVLLVTLGMAFGAGWAGLPVATGAFLTGMLISETEYRYQVSADIKPFQDVLLGVFFVAMGMRVDLPAIAGQWPVVLAALLSLVVGKGVVAILLCRLYGHAWETAFKSGVYLAQAGEFGLVLLALAGRLNLAPAPLVQAVLAAMLLSMLLAPLLIHFSAYAIRLFRRGHVPAGHGAPWPGLHDHVIVCGYGRSGQYVARFLENEGFPYIALDLDPGRVMAAAEAGEPVMYGDCGRQEILETVGIDHARALLISYADVTAAMKTMAQTRTLRPDLPIVVRTHDDSHLDTLKAGGATEVVPEVLEGSLMLASHALMLLGVPRQRVISRIRAVREQRYAILRGFFRGMDDPGPGNRGQAQLQTVFLHPRAQAVGQTLAQQRLEELGVTVTAVRRRNIRGASPAPDLRLDAGDILVLMGEADRLVKAEARLLHGG